MIFNLENILNILIRPILYYLSRVILNYMLDKYQIIGYNICVMEFYYIISWKEVRIDFGFAGIRYKSDGPGANLIAYIKGLGNIYIPIWNNRPFDILFFAWKK